MSDNEKEECIWQISESENGMRYKYITDNNLINKQDYMYSEYRGAEFIQAYKESRLSYITKGDNDEMIHDTRAELEGIKRDLVESDAVNYRDKLDSYVKRFEVSKRIYSEYNDLWKATERASYQQLDLYILLSECCMEAYSMYRCTKYLSCTLKIDDTLLSLSDKLTISEGERLRNILKRELEACNLLDFGLEMDR